MPPIFVVSTGRAGSMMLARALARHPELLALHEPLPHLNAEAYARWNGSKPLDEILASVRKKRDPLVIQAQENQLRYVESASYCSHLILELHACYGAKFVHLYRDGRDFTRSALARSWWYYEYDRIDGPLLRMKHAAQAWIRRQYLLPVGHTWNDHRLDPPSELRTRFEKIAWLWNEINRVILTSFDKLPPLSTTSLALEQLNEKTLRELLEFMEVHADDRLLGEMLDVAAKRPNRTVGPAPAQPSEWTPEQQRRFWELTGHTMRRLGYFPESSANS